VSVGSGVLVFLVGSALRFAPLSHTSVQGAQATGALLMVLGAMLMGLTILKQSSRAF
jgi:hypothetical protein